MDQEAREDYQRQQDDERRMVEEEHRRYAEAHPLADKCRNHPEREAVDPSCYDKQLCAECMADMKARYSDHRVRRLSDDGISAWIHGAGPRPSDYFKEEPK